MHDLDALHWFLEPDPPEGPCLFVGAQAHPVLELLPDVQGWQPHRGLFLELGQRGWPAPADRFRTAVVRAAPSREETLGRLAYASALADELIFVCANDQGASGYRHLFPDTAASKRKCRIWRCPPLQLADSLELREHNGHWTAPGLFSWDRVDAGTRLLLDTLPEVSGRVGDFGAGWGALSLGLRGATELHLYEVDARAVEAARRNLPKAVVHWSDLTRERPKPKFDWALVNPPFHAHGRHSLELGTAVVETALRSLRPGGQLWMVANQTLPYERALDGKAPQQGDDPSSRGSIQVRAQGSGFKVLQISV